MSVYKKATVKVTRDASVDAVYIYLREHVPGEKWKALREGELFEKYGINLDVDESGRLVGIEVLGASKALPQEFLRSIEGGRE